MARVSITAEVQRKLSQINMDLAQEIRQAVIEGAEVMPLFHGVEGGVFFHQTLDEYVLNLIIEARMGLQAQDAMEQLRLMNQQGGEAANLIRKWNVGITKLVIV